VDVDAVGIDINGPRKDCARRGEDDSESESHGSPFFRLGSASGEESNRADDQGNDQDQEQELRDRNPADDGKEQQQECNQQDNAHVSLPF